MQATILPPAAVVALVRQVQCGYCWRPVAEGACTPEGDHFVRWGRARRRGLISAEQLAAALATLTVVTESSVVIADTAGRVGS